MGKEKYLKLKLNDILTDKKREITGGIEIEVYLVNQNNKLITDQKIIDELLENLPDTITKDYYAYQLEIRTKPHSNPEEMIKELQNNIILCHKECSKRNLKIRFTSWLGKDEMFNGLHFHIRMGDNNPFLNTIINSYPIVLSYASFFRCSPGGFNIQSQRIDRSPHCGIPNINGQELSRPDNSNRYRDMVINQFKKNNRHRLKSVNTLEVRVFDVPCDWEYLTSLIKLLYNLFWYVKIDKSIINEKNSREYDKYLETATMTRDEICSCRHTFNYFLDDYNDNIVKELMKKFKIPILEENLSMKVDENPFDYSLYSGFPFLDKPSNEKENPIKNKEKVKLSEDPYYSTHMESISLNNNTSERIIISSRNNNESSVLGDRDTNPEDYYDPYDYDDEISSDEENN